MPTVSVDFSNLPHWVNDKFYPLFFDRNRWIISMGGAGSGKSYSQAQKIVYLTTAEKGHNYLVVRKTAKSNRTSTFPLLQSVINQWGLSEIFKINKTDLTITCVANGNEIRFAGLDDVEKLKSITFTNGPLTDIWIEEITETTEEQINQLNLRLRGLADVPFQITGTFNPISDRHWLKRRFFDRQNNNTTLLHTTYLDNKYLDAEYRQELENLKELDYNYYCIYALGKWGAIGDLVFQNYEIHEFDKNMYFDRVICGMDFGFNHKYAIEKIGVRDNELYFINELYVSGMTTGEVIAMNNEIGAMLPDDECIADSADPAAIMEWKNAGYNVSAAKKGPDSRNAGYSYLKTRKIHIHPSCVGMAGEIQSLKYKVDKDGETTDQIVEFKDDAIAAARYASEPLWQNGGIGFAIISDIGI